ncbi:MAG TPA: hypothetical protein VHM23_16580 [Actinomycetota bacterium]|jgi:hypothetical protein|nr:hypothetical protein [Actinomycetota bacterium]
MHRIPRALAVLALGGLILAATAAAAEPSGNADQLAARKALYESQLERNLQRRVETAPVTDSTTVELSDAERRNIARVPDPYVPAPSAAAPAANSDRALPGGDVDVLGTLLLGLFGGLVGGFAAAIGWTRSTRRRLPRTAAGT